ncbi:HU family DNA-binding protein [Desulfoferrobacter suflitae]|uniref:HU family DNA-binding protein n=1 Tax=Desulfoferrobacter suflitae TaxID=2865782 RepID=UPI002164376E|nr:HU family DNA-binding protein [Desulfoferrobacter suflitae]MCK8604408.1 HU family DNA-binding protein [Desulfoferrobacter suflitae]
MHKKSDLIRHYAKQGSVSLPRAKAAVDAVIECIKASIVEGQGLIVAGFGTFRTVIRPARQGRNPKTGEPVAIPEKIAVRFKPSAGLNDSIQPRVKQKAAAAKTTGKHKGAARTNVTGRNGTKPKTRTKSGAKPKRKTKPGARKRK